jgi:hypothetical protein
LPPNIPNNTRSSFWGDGRPAPQRNRCAALDRVQWNEGVIRIETTEHYRPKSHNSKGEVRVDPELLELFREYYARRKSNFVIESASPLPPFDVPYGFIAA